MSKLRFKQAVQIGKNVTEIMSLPCVTECYKTASGAIKYRGTFQASFDAGFGSWLVEKECGTWICVPNESFNKLFL